jgi:hypothetical protein
MDTKIITETKEQATQSTDTTKKTKQSAKSAGAAKDAQGKPVELFRITNGYILQL